MVKDEDIINEFKADFDKLDKSIRKLYFKIKRKYDRDMPNLKFVFPGLKEEIYLIMGQAEEPKEEEFKSVKAEVLD